MIIKTTLWFPGMYGFCGIVLGEDAISGERKVIVGIHKGQADAADRHMIVAGGTSLSLNEAKQILEHLKGKED